MGKDMYAGTIFQVQSTADPFTNSSRLGVKQNDLNTIYRMANEDYIQGGYGKAVKYSYKDMEYQPSADSIFEMSNLSNQQLRLDYSKELSKQNIIAHFNTQAELEKQAQERRLRTGFNVFNIQEGDSEPVQEYKKSKQIELMTKMREGKLTRQDLAQEDTYAMMMAQATASIENSAMKSLQNRESTDRANLLRDAAQTRSLERIAQIQEELLKMGYADEDLLDIGGSAGAGAGAGSGSGPYYRFAEGTEAIPQADVSSMDIVDAEATRILGPPDVRTPETSELYSTLVNVQKAIGSIDRASVRPLLDELKYISDTMDAYGQIQILPFDETNLRASMNRVYDLGNDLNSALVGKPYRYNIFPVYTKDRTAIFENLYIGTDENTRKRVLFTLNDNVSPPVVTVIPQENSTVLRRYISSKKIEPIREADYKRLTSKGDKIRQRLNRPMP